MEIMAVPQGNVALACYPQHKKDPLRAWDAADEYLLRQLHDSGRLAEGEPVLVVNDRFGALSVALAARQRVVMQTDSWLAQRGCLANLQYNGMAPDSVTLLDSLAQPEGPFCAVLLKIPKSLALLEHQLHQIRPLLADDVLFLASAMTKHIHRSTLQLFERIIGPSLTSLAVKKARLVLPQFDASLMPGPSPWPRCFTLDDLGLRFCNHAGVFSRERLDIGTRFFLDHLPQRVGAADIVDLGCGNGVVGLLARRDNPDARLLFSDESFMALDSARMNWQAAFADAPAEFVADDCLSSRPARSADLVLINPPFHQQHAITSGIAKRMFRDAYRVLRPGGECRIVGNRHLGYQRDLKRIFGNCEVVASNPKFVIHRALR